MPRGVPKLGRAAKTDSVVTGAVFGRLQVHGPTDRYDGATGTAKSLRYWLCRCSCGLWTEVRADRLAYDHTKSCGCAGITNAYTQLRIAHGRLTDSVARHQVLLARQAVLCPGGTERDYEAEAKTAERIDRLRSVLTP